MQTVEFTPELRNILIRKNLKKSLRNNIGTSYVDTVYSHVLDTDIGVTLVNFLNNYVSSIIATKNQDERVFRLVNARSEIIKQGEIFGKPVLKLGYKVGLSKIQGAGRGIFADIDYKQGDIIDIYPCDIVCVILPEVNRTEALITNKKYVANGPTVSKYLIGDSKQGIIYSTYDEVEGLNLMNDSNMDGLKTIQNVNCLYVNTIPIMYANRDIQKGEELLFCYGVNYWKNMRQIL
jgi:hypothetical protein